MWKHVCAKSAPKSNSETFLRQKHSEIAFENACALRNRVWKCFCGKSAPNRIWRHFAPKSLRNQIWQGFWSKTFRNRIWKRFCDESIPKSNLKTLLRQKRSEIEFGDGLKRFNIESGKLLGQKRSEIEFGHAFAAALRTLIWRRFCAKSVPKSNLEPMLRQKCSEWVTDAFAAKSFQIKCRDAWNSNSRRTRSPSPRNRIQQGDACKRQFLKPMPPWLRI